MSEHDRSVALTTACDDLQAQLEAGDRSFRNLDRDLSVLRSTLNTAINQAQTLQDLGRHLNELRENMREQRSALREVRRAAVRLSAAIAVARNTMTTLVEEKEILERNHAALLAEHARLRETPRDVRGHEAHGEHLRDHLAELRQFRKRLPATPASEPDPEL